MYPILYIGGVILRARGTTFGEGLMEEVSLLMVVQRQEHAVERHASWGIAQSRVDGGCAINACEAAVAAGAGRAGSDS